MQLRLLQLLLQIGQLLLQLLDLLGGRTGAGAGAADAPPAPAGWLPPAWRCYP
ncbi:hypothetical protein QNM99_26975 [Pseudomonas sp. PCH446]